MDDTLPEQMDAWRWTGTGVPLRRETVPVPVPAPDEVLLRVRAAGMCHSDVGEIDEPSWADTITRNPITLGHEIAGEVAVVGEDVTGVAVGDRVGVYPMGRTVPGYSRDGGYAAYAVAPAADLVPLPAGVAYDVAALGTDAGMTSHHAVVGIAQVRPGQRIGIIGLGGLGQIGARLAVVHGAEVHVADVSADARALGARLGVHSVVGSVDELAGADLDVVVDFAGFGTTTAGAIHAIRTGGTVVMVGLGAVTTSFETRDLIHRKAHVIGSSGGTREDVARVYEHLAAGNLHPVVEHLSFDQIPDGIARLRAGRVTGRLVVLMGDADAPRPPKGG